MLTPNQALAARAVDYLAQAGYSAQASQDGDSVTVQDPVRCSCGSHCWSARRETVLRIDTGDLRSVWRFIDARS